LGFGDFVAVDGYSVHYFLVTTYLALIPFVILQYFVSSPLRFRENDNIENKETPTNADTK